MKFSIFLLFVLCSVGVYPTVSVSRWFTASFYDLRFTLRRYGHCTGDLYPLRDYSLNETEYLIHQMKTFLDQANYDNEQLANVTLLMDNICRSDIDQSYPISVHIDVNKFSNNHSEGKANRCQAIDDALDSMFYVFKRSALNRSEPLDFSVIQFYPNTTDQSAYYNLTDLINTSWIKSETILEHVCNITDSIKRFIQSKMIISTPALQAVGFNSTTGSGTGGGSSQSTIAQKRNEQSSSRPIVMFNSIIDLIDRFLDPLLGLQKRLMWESNTRLELMQNRLSSGLGTIRDGFGNRIKSTRDRFSNMFTSTATGGGNNQLFNSTLNSTSSSTKLNSTQFNATTTSTMPLVNSSTSSFTASISSTMAPPLPPAAAAAFSVQKSTSTTSSGGIASAATTVAPSRINSGLLSTSTSNNNNKLTSPFVTNNLN